MATDSLAAVVDDILAKLRAGDVAANESLDEMSKDGTTPEPEAPAAAALDPGPKTIVRPNGETYHVRELIAAHTDVVTLRKARDNRMPVLLYGPPGTGKTALLEAAFAEKGSPGAETFYTVQGSGDTEVADFIGGYVQLPGGEFHWVDGPLIKAAEQGGVLFIDEIALVDPKVMAAVYGAMDGRGTITVTQNPERGTVSVAPTFYVVGACNPNAPGARMSEALLSRFTVQFEVLTDYKLARTLGVPSKIVTASANLSKKLLAGEVSWAPQLRELIAFAQAERLFGQEFALANLLACTPEIDRATVTDVVKRTYGASAIVPLRLG